MSQSASTAAALSGGQEATAANSPSQTVLMSPPKVDGPLPVQATFELLGISDIGDEAETVSFSGILTLVWKDARQSFDPIQEGVAEKVYSGDYQFNELSASWYPQITLANAAGEYESRAVLLRIQPDGTTTLTEQIEAVARVDLDMLLFPFDRQDLELSFIVFGFNEGEIALQTSTDGAFQRGLLVKVPQWKLEALHASVPTNLASERRAAPSNFVVTIAMKREPLFMLRLVMIPLALIVMLSWSVFWMDRSSVGDRMSVSFVGILTVVAYQITLVGIVPNVSYVTYMNVFLNFSFLIMCAAVVVNLYVAAADKVGHEHGERIDRRCRWLFPLVYLGLNAIGLATAFLIH